MQGDLSPALFYHRAPPGDKGGGGGFWPEPGEKRKQRDRCSPWGRRSGLSAVSVFMNRGTEKCQSVTGRRGSDYLRLPKEQRSNYIVCTFDDGYAGLIKNALPIMNLHGFTATVLDRKSVV